MNMRASLLGPRFEVSNDLKARMERESARGCKDMSQAEEQRRGWWRVLCLLLFFKAVYLTGLWVALSTWGSMDTEHFRSAMMRWPREDEPVFASHFATWDGAHYLSLSEVGYGPGVRSDAFYPLYPLLIRWTSAVTGGNHLVAAMVLANTMSLAAWVLFFLIARRRFGEPTAFWATVFMLVYPGALFYQFAYSESVFLLLVMVVWLGLERRRYGWMAVGGFLLPLSRAIGLFCLLPIAWHLVTRHPLGWMRRLGTDCWDLSSDTDVSSGPAERTSAAYYGLLLLPVAGWLVYLGLMRYWTGNAFEGMAAQRYWGAHSIGNLVNVPKFVIGLFNPTDWHAFRGSLLDRCLFIVLLYALPVIWRLGKDMIVWVYVLGIMPAMSGTFTSFTRYEATVFPLFLAMAVFFGVKKREWMRGCALALSGALHIWLLWRFVNFNWAG